MQVGVGAVRLQMTGCRAASRLFDRHPVTGDFLENQASRGLVILYVILHNFEVCV